MDKTDLLGTRRLKSYLVTTATGFLIYSADGRMQVVAVAKNLRIPGGTNPPDAERLALYDSMFAYAGTFSVEGDRVIHHEATGRRDPPASCATKWSKSASESR